MQEFQTQELVDLCGVVPVALQVTPHHRLHSAAVQVGSRKRAGVEKDIPNVRRQRVPIPDSEMIELVSAEEQAFQVE